jgi:hypothetical protein
MAPRPSETLLDYKSGKRLICFCTFHRSRETMCNDKFSKENVTKVRGL